jgi:hypothetical protein
MNAFFTAVFVWCERGACAVATEKNARASFSVPQNLDRIGEHVRHAYVDCAKARITIYFEHACIIFFFPL